LNSKATKFTFPQGNLIDIGHEYLITNDKDVVMPVYSNSQLGLYEQCPLKYKLRYRDRIKRGEEGVEAFLGQRVHDTLQKCYEDVRLTKLNSLGDLISFYDQIWQKNWHDAIVIRKSDYTQDHYRAMGKKMIEAYYERYAPFDSDTTISTEMMVTFSLGEDRYKLRGYIDRLSSTKDGICQIHDYKTSGRLPTQEEADDDRQLALYQIGIKEKWPDIEDVRLIWHYLAFDKDLVSTRSTEDISSLVERTKLLIDEIEAAQDFPPQESRLCDWCEYPDLCPMRKHIVFVEELPVNEYLSEPGVVLVNRYAEIKAQEKEFAEEERKVKEALIEYARKEGVEVIKGSDCKARVKFDEKLKFPGKNDEDREDLDMLIIEANKWMEVSQLDTASLAKAVESGSWDKELVDEVLKFGRIEESPSVRLSKLKEVEE